VKCIFNNQRYHIFSCFEAGVQNENKKYAKAKLSNGKHRNGAQTTDLLLVRHAFKENERSITNISM
jgi:hypothetical protein